MKSVIVTVDTEGHVGEDPIRRLIWGETADGRQCGIPLIMDLCDEIGAKALFFVDIAEAWHYGEEKVTDVLKYIEGRGHQTGIHIHPDHMADPKRLFLYEYSFDEQYEMIKKCSEFYEVVLNKKPLAFRAGKYGANWDTLKILTELHYKADFSEFYGQKWCGINPPVTGNQTVKIHDILIEIPVMSYQSKFLNIINRYDKFDTNSSFFEQSYILNRLLKEDDVDPIVIFAHSFSFLNWRAHPDKPILDKKVVSNFRRVLRMAYDRADFVGLSEILEMKLSEKKLAKVFAIDEIHSLLFYCIKAKNVITQRAQIKKRECKYCRVL